MLCCVVSCRVLCGEQRLCCTCGTKVLLSCVCGTKVCGVVCVGQRLCCVCVRNGNVCVGCRFDTKFVGENVFTHTRIHISSHLSLL